MSEPQILLTLPGQEPIGVATPEAALEAITAAIGRGHDPFQLGWRVVGPTIPIMLDADILREELHGHPDSHNLDEHRAGRIADLPDAVINDAIERASSPHDHFWDAFHSLRRDAIAILERELPRTLHDVTMEVDPGKRDAFCAWVGSERHIEGDDGLASIEAFEACYRGVHETFDAFARLEIDERGVFDAVPEALRCYIDVDNWIADYALQHFTKPAPDGTVYVFRDNEERS